MKRKQFVLYIVAIIAICILTIPASAIVYSSAQIKSYQIDATPSSNTIDVYFSISAKTLVEKLGCESIDIYKKSGDRWVFSESYDENDTKMSLYSAFTYTNTIYCSRDPKMQYKVVVTVFADDGQGRDTRTKTFYV